jgi:prepilin-type N-terminal cleavage/methylation domain-containing protein
MKKVRSRQSGFTMVELIIVVGIIGVLAGVAIFNLMAILPGFRANQAMNQVFSQLRAARELAISQRREVQIQFVGTNTMQFTELELVGANKVFPPISWEGGSTYTFIAATGDTPMAFGTCGAICFENISGGPPTMKFTPSGTLVDGGNTLLNGTVFLGVPGNVATARAVTVLGATGRVRQYHWDGTTWQE